MKPSDVSCGDPKSERVEAGLEFTLPETGAREPSLVSIPLAEFAARCDEMRGWFPGAIPLEVERWRRKSAVPFRLK